MAEHTPTPWIYIPNERFRPGTVLIWTSRGPGYGAVAELSGPNPYPDTVALHEANAEFIVRACNAHDDLLSAAKDLLEAIRAEGCVGWVFDEMRGMTARQAATLRAAIARAEG